MSRKLVLDPYLAIHGNIMAKNGHFSWNFDLFLTFFMDCGHIYVPNGLIGFHKQPTHTRRGDEPFFTLGSTVHDWGWPKNSPFWTKNGQTWQACQHSKVVQKGSENGQTKCFCTIWDPFGPIWTLLDHFKQELIFCSEAPLPNNIS